MSKQYRYKFLKTSYKSDSGYHTWKVGRWYTCDEELDICNVGFHCSKGIYQAFSYVQGEILAKVEVDGKSITQDDKECWKKMRVVKSWKWNKRDSVLFAIYAAKQVIHIWEKYNSKDRRPQEAIEAAERYIKNPTSKNNAAVRAAASAAWAAGAAARDAWGAAAWVAASAAWAAGAAADWAAGAAGAAGAAAARDAAWAAASAAWAAGAAIYDNLDKWMENHLVNLRVLQDHE